MAGELGWTAAHGERELATIDAFYRVPAECIPNG
jgi:hypothetical protein